MCYDGICSCKNILFKSSIKTLVVFLLHLFVCVCMCVGGGVVLVCTCMYGVCTYVESWCHWNHNFLKDKNKITKVILKKKIDIPMGSAFVLELRRDLTTGGRFVRAYFFESDLVGKCILLYVSLDKYSFIQRVSSSCRYTKTVSHIYFVVLDTTPLSHLCRIYE